MQVVVNTRLLLKSKLEGIGRFSHETLYRLVKMHPDWHFIFLFDRPFDEQFIYGDNVTPIELYPPARHTVLIHWYYQWSVKRLLKQLKPDLFYSPDAHGVVNPPCKQLITIHDVNFEHFITRKYAHAQYTSLNTVSEFSKNDIARIYDLEASKIEVIGNGVNNNFKPISDEEKQAVRAIFSDGKPYYFFVGSIHPRKNLENMIQAFNAFKHETKGSHKFLISGSGWSQSDLKKVFAGAEFIDDVVYLGRIKEAFLPQLIAAAEALMYVSKFEGFGIPIIEAFACKTPVITSNVSSLPEVAGDAALFSSPEDILSIKENMLLLHNNQDLKLALIDKGFARKESFSWDIMAERLSQNMIAVINAS
jgi:glycosyltransferase involved in cell wall biosynthesis